MLAKLKRSSLQTSAACKVSINGELNRLIKKFKDQAERVNTFEMLTNRAYAGKKLPSLTIKVLAVVLAVVL